MNKNWSWLEDGKLRETFKQSAINVINCVYSRIKFIDSWFLDNGVVVGKKVSKPQIFLSNREIDFIMNFDKSETAIDVATVIKNLKHLGRESSMGITLFANEDGSISIEDSRSNRIDMINLDSFLTTVKNGEEYECIDRDG